MITDIKKINTHHCKTKHFLLSLETKFFKLKNKIEVRTKLNKLNFMEMYILNERMGASFLELKEVYR